ncbi:hypothetical protein KC353_g12 [Hortaea werneckii]|nr:hypothetical protein KC353_g12 [Hortaea werneckii]
MPKKHQMLRWAAEADHPFHGVKSPRDQSVRRIDRSISEPGIEGHLSSTIRDSIRRMWYVCGCTQNITIYVVKKKGPYDASSGMSSAIVTEVCLGAQSRRHCSEGWMKLCARLARDDQIWVAGIEKMDVRRLPGGLSYNMKHLLYRFGKQRF